MRGKEKKSLIFISELLVSDPRGTPVISGLTSTEVLVEVKNCFLGGNRGGFGEQPGFILVAVRERSPDVLSPSAHSLHPELYS